ncbi:hypothetical protein ACS0TY_033345 [Phlomoides rotata]
MNHTYTGPRSPIGILIQYRTHTFTLLLCVTLRFSVSLAMAGVLETLYVPRASALLSASLPLVTGSNSVRFSEFQGLKIQPIRASVKLNSTQKLARRGSRIVCEAQETAIQGSCFLVFGTASS